MSELKDDSLDRIAEAHNVAQFVSFSPGQNPNVRRSRIVGDPIVQGDHPRGAIESLFGNSQGSLNIRCFLVDNPRGNPFQYGVESPKDVELLVRKYASEGFYTIVNEMIDVHDGGFSGVSMGGIIEFSPNDTPRAVEKSGIASFPSDIVFELTKQVYGINLALPCSANHRVEFSVHPTAVGYKKTKVLVWEDTWEGGSQLQAICEWPNNFSKLLGDKAFGLLVASAIGLPVPRTTVLARSFQPFTFGDTIDGLEPWLRTCPEIPFAGKYPTVQGWTDPFNLMDERRYDDVRLPSILVQAGVHAVHSGATAPLGENGHTVEGVSGVGAGFMMGEVAPERLPVPVIDRVLALLGRAERSIGRVRMEWVDDGSTAWVVQLHRATIATRRGVFNEGDPVSGWIEFDPRLGLDALDSLLRDASTADKGIIVTAPVGLTSHIGESIRRAGVPGRIAG